MSSALYGPNGFFTSDDGPAAHFRTSAHTGPLLGTALTRLLVRLDEALGHPDHLDVVDMGAGRGELLRTLATLDPPFRLRLTAVEKAPRPAGLPASIEWRDTLPNRITGLLIATEWLDNVPLDVVVDGRYLEVDPVTGAESPGDPIHTEDTTWLDRWWQPVSGGRAEIGLTRDRAWAEAVASVERGLAIAVDYCHLRADRPFHGTLTGFRDGRQVVPVPDGSCDITAHVAIDSVAAAGGTPYTLLSQREALRALGVDGARPPLALASTDPAGYVRALAAASVAAELTDPTGLGGHRWLVCPVGIRPEPLRLPGL